jgi:protein SCO1/2
MNRRKLFAALTGGGLGALALRDARAEELASASDSDPAFAHLGRMNFADDPDPDNALSLHSREHLNHYVQHGTFIPNAELLDQDGKTVRFYQDCVKGKIVLINFMYTKCRGKCPLVSRNLLKVQELLGDRLGKDFQFYSITISPEEDTPEVLKAYMESHEVRPGWTFLTGNKETIEHLRRALGFIDPDPELDAERTNHAGVVLYGNEPINRWAACPGQSAPEDIVFYLSRAQNGALRYPTGPARLIDNSTVGS